MLNIENSGEKKERGSDESIKNIIARLKAIASGNYHEKKLAEIPPHADELSKAVYELAEHFRDVSEVAFSASIGNYTKRVTTNAHHDELATAINTIIVKLKNVVSQANRISKGDYSSEIFTKDDDDGLGAAMYKMTKSLRDINTENIKHKDKLIKSNELLRISASTDPLTRVLNRLNFSEELNRNIDLSRRNNRTCAILLIDIDKFKLINDNFGHSAGDEVLIQFADLLTNVVRSSDRVVRMGGDEFAIILPEINNPKEASLVAKVLISKLNKKQLINVDKKSFEISIGIACFPLHGSNSLELLKSADVALYSAKRQNKSSFRVFK